MTSSYSRLTPRDSKQHTILHPRIPEWRNLLIVSTDTYVSTAIATGAGQPRRGAAAAEWIMEILKPRKILDVHRRSWRKIEHRVHRHAGWSKVLQRMDKHTSFILVRPSIVILIQPHPQARPSSHLTPPTSFNSSAAPFPNEIDTNFIAPYVMLLITRGRSLSV